MNDVDSGSWMWARNSIALVKKLSTLIGLLTKPKSTDIIFTSVITFKIKPGPYVKQS